MKHFFITLTVLFSLTSLANTRGDIQQFEEVINNISDAKTRTVGDTSITYDQVLRAIITQTSFEGDDNQFDLEKMSTEEYIEYFALYLEVSGGYETFIEEVSKERLDENKTTLANVIDDLEWLHKPTTPSYYDQETGRTVKNSEVFQVLRSLENELGGDYIFTFNSEVSSRKDPLLYHVKISAAISKLIARKGVDQAIKEFKEQVLLK